ncbi:universal stress protein [Granulosicoccaceae sp. 1_MG-2023]|nr:universal stress protein [Granulosicoccaceae sp. 1_MG-2023]
MMFKRILAPVDLAEDAQMERVLKLSISMAEANDAELHVMTVLPTYTMPIVGSYFPKTHEKDALEAVRKHLKDKLDTLDAPSKGMKGHVTTGTIYDEIMRVADELKCDLIIMASNRPELQDYLLGPNSARVVRHAKQSVFVVREPFAE